MGHLKYKILPEFNSSCKYVRYVDDCFISSDSENVSSLLFEKLNYLHGATQFTKETEVQKTYVHGSISKFLILF